MVFRNHSISTGSGAEGCLDLARLFDNTRPVEVDLGCGKGSFLAGEAQSRREINFLGVDRLSRKLKLLQMQMQEHALTNVRILRCDAFYFTRHLLPNESISVFHIYFPDPWPKKKHKKHRFISPWLVHALAAALIPCGQVRIMTDDEKYYEQIQESFVTEPRFERIEFCERPVENSTEYENKFREAGKRVNKTAYKKSPLR
ncbi:MAG: tRNA (guanosine(46)-N7)-methyltransferase TrmB [Planctomycetota bacterium]